MEQKLGIWIENITEKMVRHLLDGMDIKSGVWMDILTEKMVRHVNIVMEQNIGT